LAKVNDTILAPYKVVLVLVKKPRQGEWKDEVLEPNNKAEPSSSIYAETKGIIRWKNTLLLK
jgi:hypothetical protein